LTTAPYPNEHLGYVIVTHPFHPMSGKKFKIVGKRTISGEAGLLLQHPSLRNFAVLEEWTSLNLAPEPDQDRSQELSAESVIGLCDLIKSTFLNDSPP